MTRLYDGDTFTHEGRQYCVTFPRDEETGAPWTEHDGHGIVSESVSRAKRPGERVLASERGWSVFYDVSGTLKIARREAWGTADGQRPGESDRAYAARAVEVDYEYCYGWAQDTWCWVGVVVELLDAHGNGTDCQASLWAVESRDPDYLTTLAYELTVEALAQVPSRVTALHQQAENLAGLHG